MKFLVVFGVLAVFVQLFDCAPLESTGTSITKINGGPTIKSTYNDGKAEYFIDDKPATEQEVKAALAKASAANGIASMGSMNIGGEMTPEEQKEFEKKMADFQKNMAKQMANVREQMGQAFGKLGWPFGQ